MCPRFVECIKHPVRTLLVGIIRIYQSCISPLLGARCRFYPGCSTYARQAIEQHGCAKGCFLTLKRLVKCHPFHPGGVDNVPKK